MTLIIDTSVAVKWIVDEDGSDSAHALIGTDLVAPDLFKAELANALWKKVMRDQATTLQVTAGYVAASASISFLSASPFSERALEIALELRHPIYDCYFLALSEATGLPIITADARLIGRCAGTAWSQHLTKLR